MTDKLTPIRLEVRNKGRCFYGDLIWSDGKRWCSWQVHKTLKALVRETRCTFQGPIVQVKDGKFLPAS